MMCFLSSSFFYRFSSYVISLGFSFYFPAAPAAAAAQAIGHEDDHEPAPAGVGPPIAFALAAITTETPDTAVHHGAIDPEEVEETAGTCG